MAAMMSGTEAVNFLKNGARSLAEMSRAMRLELGCWQVALALGGTDWWLSVECTPGSEPTPHDWYHLGWLVAALGAPAGSREETYSTEKPCTWEWPAERCPICQQWPPTHVPGCAFEGG